MNLILRYFDVSTMHLEQFIIQTNKCTTYIYIYIYTHTHTSKYGQRSSVGIATHYGLDGPGIESRWGARFSAHFQNGPWDHPDSYTIGYWLLLGVKQPPMSLSPVTEPSTASCPN